MHFRWLIMAFLLCSIATAQATLQCATLFQVAVETAHEACDDMQINIACYGHSLVTASPFPQAEAFQFQMIGDVIDIAQIASLETEAEDIDDAIWGVARIDVEAFSPNSPHNTLTMLMFGDVEITNNFEPDELTGVVNATRNVNVRRIPSPDAVILGIVESDARVIIVGRNADSSWLRVRSEDFEGWLLQNFITFDNDEQHEDIIAALPDVNQVEEAYYGSMQSFFMRSEQGESGCEDLPQSGLIAQAHDKEQINIDVNDVSIGFNSTIHLQTRTQQDITYLFISVLEGDAFITSQNRTQLVQRGQAITIKLDEMGAADDVPSTAIPFNVSTMNALPVTLLPRNICIPAPYQFPNNDTGSVMTSNLSGVNVDELETFGLPEPEELGNLGWVRINYNVSNDVGNLDLDEAYDRYQPLLEQYARNGHQNIVLLSHQTYGEGRDEFLPWSEMTDEKWRMLSDELAIMACQIVKQYATQKIVAVYQIWNEQDAPIGARASVSMSNENYAYMVTQVSQAIRAADPQAIIISGGYVSGPGIGVLNALEMVRLLPSTTLLDGIAFHPYGRGVDFDSPYRVYGHIDVSIQAYSTVLPGKPLWITEFGVLDSVSDPSSAISEYAMSMLNYIDKWYGNRVAAMVWYAWAEGMDNGYGLVDNDEKPQPILYEQFTTFIATRHLQDKDAQDD